MILTGENFISSASLSSTSGIANQNIENLKIPQLSKNFIMNSPGVITLTKDYSIEIPALIIDKGTCRSIDAVATYSGGSTYSFSMNSTDSCFYYFLDQYSKSLSITSIEFTFVGETIPSIGYIFIGTYLQMPPINPSAGLYYNTTTQRTNSISGQQFTDKGYQYVETSFSFPRIPETSELFLGKTISGRQEILSSWKETEFQYEWLFPWENSLEKIPPIFGSMKDQSLKFTRSESSLYWSLDFAFREIK